MAPSLTRRDVLTAVRRPARPRGREPRLLRADDRPASDPFLYGLNTSTISGQKLPITEVVAIVSKAGYGGIEPWIRELEAHKAAGGSLKDLGKQIRDAGLSVESVIGFFPWCVDDENERNKGFEEAKRNMEMVADIGGKRIAAPPVGATEKAGMDLKKIAGRYLKLLELGDQMGVIPEAEVWGFSKTLGTLADAAYVAVASGHPKACILPDVFHMYKGGSSPEGLKLLSGRAISAIHMNDYPADPAEGARSTTRGGSIRATGWRRSTRSSATCGRSASGGCSRWRSSTAITGSRTRPWSPGRAWRR